MFTTSCDMQIKVRFGSHNVYVYVRTYCVYTCIICAHVVYTRTLVYEYEIGLEDDVIQY